MVEGGHVAPSLDSFSLNSRTASIVILTLNPEACLPCCCAPLMSLEPHVGLMQAMSQ